MTETPKPESGPRDTGWAASYQDGNSFPGPKHWHVFDIVARRPGEQGA